MRNSSFMTSVAMIVLLQLNTSSPVRAGSASAALSPPINAHLADQTVTDDPSASLTSKPSVSTVKLPNGIVGRSYLAVLEASAGRSPYKWSLQSGQLPLGLSLSSTTGEITGTPTTAETAPFVIDVHDALGDVASRQLAIATSDVAAAAPFGHVVVVVEENADYSSVVGNTAAMPYLNSLISEYGLATQYYSNTHPSIGNYEMLTTGEVMTNNDDQTPASFPLAVDNIVRELWANGRTWKAYAEGLPYAGYSGGNSGDYYVRHVPLAYLTDVQDSAVGHKGLVPFNEFSADVAAGKLPNFSFVTPNACDDAHNCSLDVADSWLKKHIAPLLTSAPFKHDGLLIIVFDESANDNRHGGGRVAAVLVSPAHSKRSYQSAVLFQHQSTLRLILESLGVDSLPGAAAKAANMWEFFSFPAPAVAH